MWYVSETSSSCYTSNCVLKVLRDMIAFQLHCIFVLLVSPAVGQDKGVCHCKTQAALVYMFTVLCTHERLSYYTLKESSCPQWVWTGWHDDFSSQPKVKQWRMETSCSRNSETSWLGSFCCMSFSPSVIKSFSTNYLWSQWAQCEAGPARWQDPGPSDTSSHGAGCTTPAA